MAPITAEGILIQQSMLTLRYQFLYHYNSLSYVDELFDMIEADKLRKWIVGQFLRDFMSAN